MSWLMMVGSSKGTLCVLIIFMYLNQTKKGLNYHGAAGGGEKKENQNRVCACLRLGVA